jgi:hypothetical protein
MIGRHVVQIVAVYFWGVGRRVGRSGSILKDET